MTDQDKLVFAPVMPGDYDRLFPYTSAFGEGSCQHSPVTLYTLREKYGDTVCIQDGTLYIRREKLCTGEMSVCLFPLGGGELRHSVERLLDDAHRRGTRLRFFTVTERAAQALGEAFPGRFSYEENRDYAEYIYRAERLAEMSGPELAKKRNNLRRFYRSCPGALRTEALDGAHLPDIYAFLDEWMAQNMEDHDAQALERERKSIEMQLSHFETFRLRGVVVYIDEKLCGFAYGTPLSEQMFDGLVMKGDRGIRQLGVLLYQEAARCCGCVWLNAEEDLGIPGLRESKLSYRPERLLKKYVVTEV